MKIRIVKTGILASFAILVGWANGIVTAWGANGTETDEPAEISASTTEQELLLFVEEKDLVTATKRAVSLRKAPAIATIISSDEIREMGARNLLDVLKMVPGIGISINEIGMPMVEVRGIRTYVSEKILVMIDGHSLNRNITGSAFFNNVDMLPVENIRQVEIIRGPGSALYGTSAFVATINIITRTAEEIDGVEVKGGGGSFDSYKGNLVAGKSIGDKFTASGSVDYYRSRGPRLLVEADALTGTLLSMFSMAPGYPGTEARQTDAFLKVGYGDLSFRGGYTDKRRDSFIGFTHALVDDNYIEHETYWGEVGYARVITDGVSANLKLRYDHFEQSPNVKLWPNGFTLGPGATWPGGMIGRPYVKDRTIGGELQIDWNLFTGNHLIAGFSFDNTRQYDVKQQANFNPLTGAPYPTVQDVANWNKDVTRDVVAFYLQDEWQLPWQVNLTAGVRYDHYSDFGDTVNPRLGLVWSFLDNADLKLLYGQAFRAPNFQELYNINNPAQMGNFNLKPERIQTYEAALSYRQNRYLAGSLNYFYSMVDDQIDVDLSATPQIYANIGKTKTQGVELGLNGAITNELSWKANYAWQDPRDALTDRRLPYVPSQRITGSVNYAPVKYLNLHTDILWTGPRPRAAGESRPEMPSYTVVDLSVTLKNFFETLEIQATVRNLFDRRYKDPDTSGVQVKVPNDFPRDGISAFVTALYRF